MQRQVGAHLWHEGPAGGISRIRTHNLLTLACLEVQALPLSYLLLLTYYWLTSYVMSMENLCHCPDGLLCIPYAVYSLG